MASDAIKRIEDTMRRHNLDRKQMARYLGVPVTTLNGWLNGSRGVTSSTVRLLDVLGRIEAFAPAIHDTFIER